MYIIFKRLLLIWTLFFTTFLFADESIVNIHIDDVTANESAGTMTFTISLSETPILPVTVDFNTLDGSALAGTDYVAKTDYLLFGLGISSRTFTIDILNDSIYETTQEFYIHLSSSSSGYVSNYDGTGTITDDDVQPLSVSVFGNSVTETDANTSLSFRVQVNQPAPVGGLSIGYTTNTYVGSYNSATVGDDYIVSSGTLIINEGDSVGYISVPIIGDLTLETTEKFLMTLTSINQGTIDASEGIGTIYDNDQIQVTITSSDVSEGNVSDTNQMEFKISLAKAYTLSSDYVVNYNTADGSTPTATSDVDYTSKTGTLTFSTTNPTEVKTVLVDIIGDNDIEEDEYLRMVVRDASNTYLGYSQSLILNDDGSYPVVSCTSTNVSILEGNSGQSLLTYNFTLDAPALASSSFEYETVDDDEDDKDDDDGDGDSHNDTEDDDSDHDGDDDDDHDGDGDDDDYVSVPKTMYTINTGDTNITLSVNINSDTKIENDEVFTLQLSNAKNIKLGSCAAIQSTIVNDDGSYPALSFTQSSFDVIEGNSSTTTVNFELQLDKPALANSFFEYYTTDGTATLSNEDYVEVNRTTYTFSGGETNVTIPVSVKGDVTFEANEYFHLTIENSVDSNLTISSNAQADANIVNDDEEEFPFTCSETSFISFNIESTPVAGDSKFNTISLADGTLIASDVLTSVNGVNSIGYNVKDNFVWGYNLALNKVVRIDSRKQAKVYDIAGLVSRFYVAADVDENGILYLFSRESATERKRLVAVDLNTLTVLASVTLNQEISTADMAFNPLDGNLYFIQDGTSNLYKVTLSADKLNGIVSLVGDMGLGAVWPIINFFDKNGNFYFNKDLTSIYKVNVLTSSTAIWVSDLDASLRNGDGARCANAPVTIPITNDEPLTCDSSMYISSSIKRGTGETGSMWLHKIDTKENPFAFNVVDDIGDVKFYNALAYSEAGDVNATDFLFGLYHDELLRIGLNGKAISWGTVPALTPLFANRQLFAGAIYNGFYYVSGPGVDYDTIFKINLSNKSSTEIKLSTPISLLDFSFTPDGKYLHGIITGGEFVQIDVADGNVTKIGTAHVGYEFDSTFSDKNGRFFANDSKGNGFFEFDVVTGNKKFISNSQPATFNDGANCINAELVFVDYGDAPSSYGTPRHNIANGIFMGDEVDHDVNAYTGADAFGDDTNGVDDEDGVTLADGSDINGTHLEPDTLETLSIKVSKTGYLNAWVDYNADGDFEDIGEKIFSAKMLVAGTQEISFTVPHNIKINTTSYLRFRYSSTASLTATQNASDGEIEDYAIQLGSDSFRGKFNVERTNSGSFQPIMTDVRNAWYTQTVGRDFNYSVVFYEEDFSAEKNISNVTLKIDLMDMDKNISIYQKSFHVLDTHIGSRMDILDANDLKNLPATKNARFRITYGVDSNGNVIQADCLTSPALCSYNRAPDEAKDNFAIRPLDFYVSIADGVTVRKENTNTLPNPFRMAAGYEYNLTVKATPYPALNYSASEGYNATPVGTLEFVSNGSCADESNKTINTNFINGIFNRLNFTTSNVGEYLLSFKDTTWTQVDADKNQCNSSSSAISNDPNLPSGCNIEAISDINLSFYPYQFDVNFQMSNLPSSGHDDFIYMSRMSLSNHDTALQFSGTITAQNKNNAPTTNFTQGCMATDTRLFVNANMLTEDGNGSTQIQTSSNPTHPRAVVPIQQIAQFNNEPLVNSDLIEVANMDMPLNILRDKFLDANSGVLTLDLKYNIKKHLSLTINPIQLTIQNVTVSSDRASSTAKNLVDPNPYIPAGVQEFHDVARNFYFSRVSSDKESYPKIIFDDNPVIRTPLNVDIFCDTTIAYCDETGVREHTDLTGLFNLQDGWYISTDHNTATDGMIRELNPNRVQVTVTPNRDINLTKGRNGLITNTFNACNSKNDTVMVEIVPDEAQLYSPLVTTNGHPSYTVSCSDQNSSQLSGIGQSGNVIDNKLNKRNDSKMEW